VIGPFAIWRLKNHSCFYDKQTNKQTSCSKIKGYALKHIKYQIIKLINIDFKLASPTPARSDMKGATPCKQTQGTRQEALQRKKVSYYNCLNLNG